MQYEDEYEDEQSKKLREGKARQERLVRLDTLRRIYEQADRVLTQDPVKILLVEDSDKPPAWSDGENVYINSANLSDFDLDSITEITSLNYHELSHLLYTPRKGSDLMKWVLEQNAINKNDLHLIAVNMLEDQRADTLLVARYPSIGPFLTKGAIRWLAETPETVASNYLVIRGRRFLPAELRTAFRDQFFDQSLIPSIIDIVDQYRVLAFPRDYAKARELITRFVEEILLKLPKQMIPKQGGCTMRESPVKGRPEPRKSQERDANRAKGMGEQEPIFTPKSQDDASSEADSESSDEATDTSSNTNNDVESMPMSSDIESQKVKDQFANTYGLGHSPSNYQLPDNIDDILFKIDNEVSAMKEVIQDSKAKQKVIVGKDDKYTDTIRQGQYAPLTATLAAIAAARKFARELRMIKRASEPGWDRETSSGKINISRVIRGCNLDEAFDRWDEGDDRTDLEAVILVDRSGSMGSEDNDVRASEAIWALKVALQEIDCPTTVYAFDDSPELVFSKNEKANKVSIPYIAGRGGTNPSSCLVSAERVLLSSRSSKKLMILITDGSYNRSSDEVVRRLNSRGVLTVMMLIESHEETIRNIYNNPTNLEHAKHDCKIFGVVKNAGDLLPFAKKIVVEIMKPGYR